MTTAGLTVHVQVPHDGDGSHTLLVALPVDDRLLDDPAEHARLVQTVAEEVTALLRTRRPATTGSGRVVPLLPGGCERCGADPMPGGARWCLPCFQAECGSPRVGGIGMRPRSVS